MDKIWAAGNKQQATSSKQHATGSTQMTQIKRIFADNRNLCYPSAYSAKGSKH
jgi:hypothetical protein